MAAKGAKARRRKSNSSAGYPKPIFEDLVICTDDSVMDSTWSDVNITRWVSLRKGVFTYEMDASATHLVCSEDDIKHMTPKGMIEQPRAPRP